MLMDSHSNIVGGWKNDFC